MIHIVDYTLHTSSGAPSELPTREVPCVDDPEIGDVDVTSPLARSGKIKQIYSL